MTPLLTTLFTSLAADVDDIKIAFNESSLTTLRVVIALVVVAVALPVVAPALGNLVRDAVAPLGH